MNMDKNINMTIDCNLAKPILVRQLTLDKIVTRHVLEMQVSEAYPYNLSFPVTLPVLEMQVSADIDWEAYPYNLSFPKVNAKL